MTTLYLFRASVRFSSLIFLLFMSFHNSFFSKTYYVNNSSPVASDTNSGTYDFPWKTIHKANRTITAGDTVIVMPGTYHDWIFPDACGEPNNWIVYKSAIKQEAVLNGFVALEDAQSENAEWQPDNSFDGNVWSIQLISNAFLEAWADSTRYRYPFPYSCDSLEFGLHESFVDSTGRLYVWLDDGDEPAFHEWHVSLKSGVWLINNLGPKNKYLIVDGFTVEKYGLAGISVAKNYVKIKNCISRENGRAGIEVIFCNYVYIDDNIAAENCKGVGFSQGITAYRVTGREVYFRRNISHDNYDGDDPEHCGTDGSGFTLDTAEPNGGAVFINNVAYNNVGTGFGVFKSSHAYFINNTSFNNGKKNQFITECRVVGLPDGPSNDLVFRNNIFACRASQVSVLKLKYAYSEPPRNVLFDHNLYYRVNSGADADIFGVEITSSQGDSTCHLTLDEFRDLTFPSDTGDIELNWGDSSLVASPDFVNWRAGDFRLIETSPAIDNGSGVYAPDNDYYNTPRPQGAGFDIGAYEYVPGGGVNSQNDEKIDFELLAYPNPFNSSVIINFNLPEKKEVFLTVYDIRGRETAKIIEGEKLYGRNKVVWNAVGKTGKSVASGVYFVRICAGSYSETKKIIYLK